ncbi:MAG: hypothetical protein JO041_05880 [Acidobacteria bacterium]|nr:hypothetical protein [Acidobacteriota bacterium]
MAERSLRQGQLWRSDSTGDVFLVTKIYTEVFSEIAVLRRTPLGAALNPKTVRVRITRSAGGANLPGYTFTQEVGAEF